MNVITALEFRTALALLMILVTVCAVAIISDSRANTERIIAAVIAAAEAKCVCVAKHDYGSYKIYEPGEKNDH